MVALVKYNSLPFYFANKTISLSTDTFKVLLTNQAPNVATHNLLASVTQIAAGNGYVSGGNVAARVGGTIDSLATTMGAGGAGCRAFFDDVVFTAAGGPIGPFRYAVLYDASPTGFPLIGYIDYGSAITLNDGDSFTVDFNGTTGVLVLA